MTSRPPVQRDLERELNMTKLSEILFSRCTYYGIFTSLRVSLSFFPHLSLSPTHPPSLLTILYYMQCLKCIHTSNVQQNETSFAFSVQTAIQRPCRDLQWITHCCLKSQTDIYSIFSAKSSKCPDFHV